MLKNIQQTIQLPLLPTFTGDIEEYIKANEQWGNDLQRFLEDYARTIADNIMEQPRWDDFRVAAGVAKPGVTAPTYGAFGPSGGLQTWLFASGADNMVHFEVQIPHATKLGTKLHPHVHFAPTTTDSGNVCWGLEYSWANIKTGELLNTTFLAPTIIRATKDVNGVAWEHLLATFDPIEIEFNISAMLVCRLFRDVSEDNYGADAAYLEFDIHMEKDSVGSREEYNK